MNPRIDTYEWERGREVMLRFGPADGPMVVAALPLLEEANRTRAFVVTILRALAERGIGGVLPDLPGTGESLVATRDMRLTDLRGAYAAAVRASGTRVFGLAVRSGALLDRDAEVAGRWHLAPQTGEELLKEWRRIAGGPLDGEPVEVAGNLLSHEFFSDLTAVLFHPRAGGDPVSVDQPGSPALQNASLLDPRLRGGGNAGGGGAVRVIRLNSDLRPSDLTIEGTPLWRRAEPDNNPVLAQRLAADIVDWIATCGG